MKHEQNHDVDTGPSGGSALFAAAEPKLHRVCPALGRTTETSDPQLAAGLRLLRGAVSLLLLAALLLGCGKTTTVRLNLPAVRTVAHVDLARYLGRWYEIANYPNRFQKGCTKTTAEYSLKEPGVIEVVNRCRKDSPDGKEKVARGRAHVVETKTNAKLKVSFFRPFWGDYWIIDLDPHYRYAVVGHPGRDYLWILSRTPEMDPATYDSILSRLQEQDYDTSRIVRTLQ